MNRKLRWILVNGCMMALVWLAVFGDYGSAQNLLKFIVGVQAFVVVMALFSDECKKTIRNTIKSVPLWVDHSFDALVCAIFASQGWFWCAFVFLLTIVSLHLAHQSDDDQ